jgi:hypothetical protein
MSNLVKFYITKEGHSGKTYLNEKKVWVSKKKDAFINEAPEEFARSMANKYGASYEVIPTRGKK